MYDFQFSFLKRYFLTIRHISIGVMRFDQEGVGVQNCKSVNNMSADSVVNIFWIKLSSSSLSVCGPVCEVTHNLEISRQTIVQWPREKIKIRPVN